MFYDQLFRIGMLVVLTTVVAVPKLRTKYLVMPSRRSGRRHPLFSPWKPCITPFRNPLCTARILDDLGFAFLLFSFAYVALQLVLASERRVFWWKKNFRSLARSRPRSSKGSFWLILRDKCEAVEVRRRQPLSLPPPSG